MFVSIKLRTQAVSKVIYLIFLPLNLGMSRQARKRINKISIFS